MGFQIRYLVLKITHPTGAMEYGRWVGKEFKTAEAAKTFVRKQRNTKANYVIFGAA